MFAVPVVPVVTMPVREPIAATPVAPLCQVPPGVGLLKVDVPPWQAVKIPVIVPGTGFTLTVVDVTQPPGKVYVTTQVP
jgi:hypothetical protein